MASVPTQKQLIAKDSFDRFIDCRITTESKAVKCMIQCGANDVRCDNACLQKVKQDSNSCVKKFWGEYYAK